MEMTFDDQGFVICSNRNCEESIREIIIGDQISHAAIFCGNLHVGEENVKKLGGKFKRAFVGPNELMEYLVKQKFASFDKPKKDLAEAKRQKLLKKYSKYSDDIDHDPIPQCR